jgi:hypothetical protein
VLAFLLLAAAATFVLLTTDAFFAFAGWRMLASGPAPWQRACGLHARAERHEPWFAAVAMAASVMLGVGAGLDHPRVSCLAGGAVVALAAHLVVYTKVACLMRGFEAAPIGSEERTAVAGRLESAMVTRASLQGAAFICIVAAGMMR